MQTLNDKILGQLTFDVMWSRPYNIQIFGLEKSITLVIQTFDDDIITDNQRRTFQVFEKEKYNIISDVEKSLFVYYKSQFNTHATSISEVSSSVDLLNIKIMYTEEGEAQEIGFIFSANFDPELGVGVLVSNGKVKNIDVQDIVLG